MASFGNRTGRYFGVMGCQGGVCNDSDRTTQSPNYVIKKTNAQLHPKKGWGGLVISVCSGVYPHSNQFKYTHR